MDVAKHNLISVKVLDVSLNHKYQVYALIYLKKVIKIDW